MQAAGQSDRHSPRSLLGSTLSHQPKMNCDVIQNSSLPTKGKGRKREKIDHNPDSCKRERVVKMENNDMSHQKQGYVVKPDEIANIVDKDGGLVNLPSVDRLVNLMQQDCDPRIKKACEVTSWRIMLVGVIASTEKEECLNRFVQLGGLPMLNDWLQEAHKGKDGGSPKEGDKGLEELLMTLLQALDKLPVDLDALKKCIVGKSVNNLRSHKNSEIQKKARKLVDTWKKRVDAEMKLSGDSKTVHGSASKQSSVDPSGNSAETSEISKSLSATKGVANISAVDDSVTKYVSDIVCSGISQVLTTGVKDHLLKGHALGSTEVSLGTMKEDKSSNSSQSQNNSQSWSGGPSNGALSTSKEDAKLSSAVSAGKKASNTMSHDSVTSIKGDSSGSLAAQKESVSRLLVWGRVVPQEKVAHFVPAEKGSFENVRAENLNNQRVIVRLPNPGRSTSCTANGGSFPDATMSNRGSSPSFSERHQGEIKMHNNSETSDGKSEIGRGDDKGRSLLDYTECRNMGFEHTSIDVENGVPDEKKGPTMNVSASVDLSAADFGDFPVDGNEVGIGQLVDEERRKGGDAIDNMNFTGTYGNIGGAMECAGNSIVDTGGLAGTNMQKMKTSNMSVMVAEETKKGEPGLITSGCYLATESCVSAMEVDCEVTEKDDCVLSKEGDVIEEKKLNEKIDIDDECQLQDNVGGHIENGESAEAVDGVGGLDTKTKNLPKVTSVGDVPRATEAKSQSYQDGAIEAIQSVTKEGEAEQNNKIGVQDASPVTPKNAFEETNTLAQQGDTMIKIESSPDKLLVGTFACSDDSQVAALEIKEERDTLGTHEVVAGDQVPPSGNTEKTKVTIESMLDRSIDGCKVEGTRIEESYNCSESIPPERVLKIVTHEAITTELRDIEPTVGSESSSRPLFDLNEGAFLDEPLPGNATSLTASRSPGLLSGNSLAVPIAVVATAKGIFIPSLDSIPCKSELGWKGSAATSAFRPAEPRRMQESSCCSSVTLVKNARDEAGKKQPHTLDIDLNVADDKVLEDSNADALQGSNLHLDAHSRFQAGGEVPTIANGVGSCFSTAARPELDLNLANESEESLAYSVLEIIHDKMTDSNSMYPVVRNFDLNTGPSLEDVSGNEFAAQNSAGKINNFSALPSLPGWKINLEVNVASPFPTNHSSTEVTLPFIAPRTGPLYPIVSAVPANSFLRAGPHSHCFNQESYAPIPAVSYSMNAAVAFPYTDFSLRADFPPTSSAFATNMISYMGSSSSMPFPTVPSQLIGAGTVVSPYRMPYLFGITKAPATENYTSISRPNLDLNAGPEIADMDVRNEATVTKQPCGLGHLSFSDTGIVVGPANAKESEGAIDPFRSRFEQPMRQ